LIDCYQQEPQSAGTVPQCACVFVGILKLDRLLTVRTAECRYSEEEEEEKYIVLCVCNFQHNYCKNRINKGLCKVSDLYYNSGVVSAFVAWCLISGVHSACFYVCLGVCTQWILHGNLEVEQGVSASPVRHSSH
jgi:hypothetical protein